MIYNTNIFSVIKKIDDFKSKTITHLKNVRNEIRFINQLQKINNYRISPQYKEKVSILFKQKKELIDTYLFLNTAYSMIDRMFQQEIVNAELKREYCCTFIFHRIFMLLYPKWGVKCIPEGYIKPEDSCSNIFQKLMGIEGFSEISENGLVFNSIKSK